jgi:hypothetical protein
MRFNNYYYYKKNPVILKKKSNSEALSFVEPESMNDLLGFLGTFTDTGRQKVMDLLKKVKRDVILEEKTAVTGQSLEAPKGFRDIGELARYLRKKYNFTRLISERISKGEDPRYKDIFVVKFQKNNLPPYNWYDVYDVLKGENFWGARVDNMIPAVMFGSDKNKAEERKGITEGLVHRAEQKVVDFLRSLANKDLKMYRMYDAMQVLDPSRHFTKTFTNLINKPELANEYLTEDEAEKLRRIINTYRAYAYRGFTRDAKGKAIQYNPVFLNVMKEDSEFRGNRTYDGFDGFKTHLIKMGGTQSEFKKFLKSKDKFLLDLIDKRIKKKHDLIDSKVKTNTKDNLKLIEVLEEIRGQLFSYRNQATKDQLKSRAKEANKDAKVYEAALNQIDSVREQRRKEKNLKVARLAKKKQNIKLLTTIKEKKQAKKEKVTADNNLEKFIKPVKNRGKKFGKKDYFTSIKRGLKGKVDIINLGKKQLDKLEKDTKDSNFYKTKLTASQRKEVDKELSNIKKSYQDNTKEYLKTNDKFGKKKKT